MVDMSREEFEEAVRDGLDLLPAEIARGMDNVVVVVAEEPPADEPELLGLYEGVPLTERGESWGLVNPPDTITIFRGPLLRMCQSAAEVRKEVAVTVLHEIGHHFGIEEDRLHELGWG